MSNQMRRLILPSLIWQTHIRSKFYVSLRANVPLIVRVTLQVRSLLKLSSQWVCSEVGSANICQHENGIGRRTALIPASGLFQWNCSWFLGEPYYPEMSNEFNENNNLTIQWYGTQPCISTWYLIPLIFLIFQFTFPVSYFHTTLHIQNRHGWSMVITSYNV